MQQQPLLISSYVKHASQNHHDQEIVTLITPNTVHRTTFSSTYKRIKQCANALIGELGIKPGDVVGTMAMNTNRHLELYYAVSGIGAILHTINPKLFREQIEYIVNHAQDVVLFLDPDFVPLVEILRPSFKSIRRYVILTDKPCMPNPETDPLSSICYEDFIHRHSDDFDWPVFDENTPSGLCYTSGTTGNPKGVLYTHRSTLLHTLVSLQRDALGFSNRDTVLVIVPLFHSNAWGMPYSAFVGGVKIVFPGKFVDGKHIFHLLRSEKVTVSMGVPTVWQMLLNYVDSTPGLADSKENLLPELKRLIVGGSALPPVITDRFKMLFNTDVIQGWGMTETSPMGVINTFKKKHLKLTGEEKLELQRKQGRVVYGVELKILDDEKKEVPRDGKSYGNIYVKGPWVASGYYKLEDEFLYEGWLPTGDVGTIDQDGYLLLTDRSKDVIKSGGEWISSIDVENKAMSHPDVEKAAVIGIPHQKWGERPIIIIQKKPGATNLTKDDILKFLSTRVAKWWLPDDVIFDELPMTATGKVSKRELREKYKEHKTGLPC